MIPAAATDTLLLSWSADPMVVLGLLGAAYLYVAYRPAQRRAEDGHPVLFWLGLACFAFALLSPLHTISDRYLLSAHMAQHILLTMVGPPLLLAGLPAGRLTRLRINPWLAVGVFNLVLLIWHWPGLYEATLYNQNIHILEHLTFTVTGLVFWWPIVGPGSRGAGRMSPLLKIGYLGFAAVPPTVLGMILAIDPAPLYQYYALAPRLFSGINAVLDQQLAGILMFGLGNVIYFVPVTINFMRLGDEAEVAAASS